MAVKAVCHDMTGIRSVRRAALKAQAFLDRDFGNQARKAKHPITGMNTGKNLFQYYLEDNKKPLFYVLKRQNQRKRKAGK